jgi:hypothetical protein
MSLVGCMRHLKSASLLKGFAVQLLCSKNQKSPFSSMSKLKRSRIHLRLRVRYSQPGVEDVLQQCSQRNTHVIAEAANMRSSPKETRFVDWWWWSNL